MIENAPEVDRLPVKAKPRFIPGDFPKPEVAFYPVKGPLKGVFEGRSEVVEPGVIGMPKRRLLEDEGKPSFRAVIDLDGGLGDDRTLPVKGQGKLPGHGPGKARRDDQGAILKGKARVEPA